MPSTTDDNQDRGIFGLFKGDSGSGKSVAALSFPEPYVFDHDRKMPAISQKHFPGKKVDYDNFTDIFQISEKLESLFTYCPYETLIGDSVTSLSYTALKSIDDVKSVNVLSMLKNVRATRGGTQQIELRGYDYYNGEDSFLKYYLDNMKALWARPGNPKHVILIAHVLTAETTDIKTKVMTRTRRIVTAGKNIAAYIPAQFDEVYHFGHVAGSLGSDEGIRHVCSTEAIGEDNAKTAYKIPRLIDFTNGSLYDILGQNGVKWPTTTFEYTKEIEAAKVEVLNPFD